MKTYFAYVRVSTTKQGQEGVSLTEQKSAIRQYAAREDLSITGWFEETVTAAKQGRPVFSKILERIKAGEAHGLIVHKLDRGTRNLDEWIILRDLHKQGIDLRIVVENIDLSTRSGRMIGNFQAIIAEDYIENLRQETLKGQMGRLKQGLTPWRAPIGYLNNGKGEPKTIDPIKGPLVRKIFELYAGGGYSIKTLAVHMQELGLRNTANGAITKNTISKTLNNSFYAGRIYVKKWDKSFVGAHQALINKSLFYAVQDRLAGKVRSHGYRHSFRYRKAFRCALCHYSMIGERQKGNIYYRCQTKSCPTKGVREERIDQRIDELFSNIALDRDFHALLSLALANRQKDTRAAQEQALSACLLQRANIKARRQRLTDLRLDDEIDESEFKAKKTDIQRKLDELDERETSIQSKPTLLYIEAEKFLELVQSLISQGMPNTDDELRVLLDKTSSNRTISPESIDLPCLSPWHLLLDRPKRPSCGQDRDTTRTADDFIEELLEALSSQHPQRPQSQ